MLTKEENELLTRTGPGTAMRLWTQNEEKHRPAQSTPETLLAEHRHWAEAFQPAEAGTAWSHGNDRTPDRRLRIGALDPVRRGHHHRAEHGATLDGTL